MAETFRIFLFALCCRYILDRNVSHKSFICSLIFIVAISAFYLFPGIMSCTLREGSGDGDDQTSSGGCRPLGTSAAEPPAAPGFSSRYISQPAAEKTAENKVRMDFFLLLTSVQKYLILIVFNFFFIHSSCRANQALNDDKPGN